MQDKGDHACTTDNQRYESAPAVPWILNASPGDRNQETRGGCEEKRHTNPIDFLELAEKRVMLHIELEEERDEDCANAEEWEVDPKDPAPTNILCKAPA